MFPTDHFFLLYFLPAYLLLYFLVKKNLTLSNILILVISILFYASFKVKDIWYLLLPLPIDYFISKILYKSDDHNLKKLFLFFQVSISLIMLGYFKYTIFIAETAQGFFNDPLLFSKYSLNIIAPVGISFLTFQRISYVVDVYRKKIKPANNLLDYLVYATYFPHLIAGPIVRFNEISKELVSRKVTLFDFYEGIKYMSIGLFLKIFIADRIFLLEEALTVQLMNLNALLASILILSFTLRIYFDFLGYSLLAIGIVKFTGFTFPDNFDSPYRADSIQDFWRRWNMTLSRWIRDYVYIPLGGNRKGEFRTSANILVTMLLAGLWHGAAWTFIIWGGLHGIGLVIERYLHKLSLPRPSKMISQIIVFIFVTLCWIPFKFDSIEKMSLFLSAFKNIQYAWPTVFVENRFYITLPIFALALFWIVYASEVKIAKISPTPVKALGFVLLFFVAIILTLVRRGVPFIYFQF